MIGGRGLLLPGLVSRKTLLMEMWEKGPRYKAKGANQCHPQGECAWRSVTLYHMGFQFVVRTVNSSGNVLVNTYRVLHNPCNS